MPTRLMAVLLLIISLSMIGPLVSAAMRMARGTLVPVETWAWPMLILATGTLLMWLLRRRKQIPMQLFVAALALWVLTAAYFWVVFMSSRA